MFYSDSDIIDFFKKVAEIKSEGKSAYVVYDDEWMDVMDKDELEQFAADQLDCTEDIDDEETSDYLRSLNLSDVSSIKKVLEMRYFEMIEI